MVKFQREKDGQIQYLQQEKEELGAEHNQNVQKLTDKQKQKVQDILTAKDNEIKGMKKEKKTMEIEYKKAVKKQNEEWRQKLHDALSEKDIQI